MPAVPILMVPIHLDALLLEQDRAVVDAMVDFTQLPFFDGTRDVNSDTAYLSEAILSSPFANQNPRPPTGVHLHWALPDALTRGRPTSDGQAFPPAPNRWLVVRSRGEGKDAIEQAWVVESDYLHPDGGGAETGSVAYPVDPSPDRGAYRPYRYLYRVVSLKDWKVQDPTAERLGRLTGRGVRGAHLRRVLPQLPQRVRPARRRLHRPAGGPALRCGRLVQRRRAGLSSKRSSANLRTRTRGGDQAGGPVGGSSREGPDVPESYAVLRAADVRPLERWRAQRAGDSAITIAVGNTGPQALSAYLADAIGGEQRAVVEQQLEAMLLAPRPRAAPAGPRREVQGGPARGRFRRPSCAGSLWVLRQETTASALDRRRPGRPTGGDRRPSPAGASERL